LTAGRIVATTVRPLTRWIVALLAISLAGAACAGGDDQPSPPPATPLPGAQLGDGEPHGSGAVDGLTVEVWLNEREIALGDVLFALVRLSNHGDQDVPREGNTCGDGPAPAVVESDPSIDRGAEWDGLAAEFKQDVLAAAGLRGEGEPSVIGRLWAAPICRAVRR
jgi:hypothetical protein